MIRRVRVVGNSGAGKTRFAARLARRLEVPHLELDAIFHRPNWTPAPPEEFRAEVADFLAAAEAKHGGWVVDGNYASPLGDEVCAGTDTTVWLDYPRALVMTRVLRRTARRLLCRRRLWNGNRERLAAVLSRDPERNILLWSWRQHSTVRERYLQRSESGGWVRLRRPVQAERWLASVQRDACG